MNWLILIIAGFMEVGWALGLEYSKGFTRPWITLATLLVMTASVGLLSVAMKTIPIGTAYAVWVGIGIVGTVIYGIFVFHEAFTFSRALFLGCILAGIAGLKATSQPKNMPPQNKVQNEQK